MNNKALILCVILITAFASLPSALAFSFESSDGGITMFAIAKNSCTDTDLGKTLDTRGTTTVTKNFVSTGYTDYCYGTTLIEYYCNNVVLGKYQTKCPTNSYCSEGACVPMTCTDSDGQNIYSKGTVTRGGLNYVDVCSSDMIVTENYCSGTSRVTSGIHCPENYYCSDGACIEKPPVCLDSDGGKNYDVQGRISDGKSNFTDKCNDNSFVTEYFCNGNVIDSENAPCSPGKLCQNGACVDAQCADTDGGQNKLVKGITSNILGSYTDTCVGGSILEYYCDGAYVLSASSPCDVGYLCENGACVLAPPTCSETDGGANWGIQGTTTRSNGESYTDSCNPTTGTLNEYSCKADGTILINSGHICLTGTVCENGACVAGSCSDTDGGQWPNTFGTVTRLGVTSTDTCVNSTSVTEYYCSFGAISSTTMKCGENTLCANGKCTSQGDTCFDSDDTHESFQGPNPLNESYPIQGTTTITSGAFSSSETDYCDAAGKLKEFYCDGTTRYASTVSCPTDTVCSDGACIVNTPIASCSDSDGGQTYNVGGTVTTDLGVFADTCIIGGKYEGAHVTEYYCDGTSVKSINYECPSDQYCKDDINACAPKTWVCTDTDGGNVPNVKGAIDGYSTATGSPSDPFHGDDYCYTGANGISYLREYSCCLGGCVFTSYEITCPTGQYCSDGACIVGTAPPVPVDSRCGDSSCNTNESCTICSADCGACPAPQPTLFCTDSDGGAVYGTTGSVTYYDTATESNMTLFDICSSGKLQEYLCSGTSYAMETVTCPSGQYCNSGACVPDPGANQTNQTAPETCADSDGGLTYGTSGTVTTQSNSFTDICVYPYDKLTEYYCEGTTAKSTSYTCPSDQYCKYDARACVPKVWSCVDSDGGVVASVKGSVHVFPINGGTTDDETHFDVCVNSTTLLEYKCCEGACILNTESITCPSGQVCTDGACVAGTAPTTCTDSDGGKDYYTYGIVDDGTYKHNDYCYLSNGTMVGVTEQYCENGVWKSENYVCPYGCSGAVCLASQPGPSSTNDCFDTDGSVITSKGNCSCTDGTGGTDTCDSTANNLVKEYYVGGEVDHNLCLVETIQCPSAYICSNGICVPPANQTDTNACTETDGGKNFYVQGSLTAYVNGAYAGTYPDYCYPSGGSYIGLTEQYCENNLRKTEDHICQCESGACVGTAPTADSRCGDSTCNTNESCTICAADCGACATNASCSDSDGGRIYTLKGTTASSDGSSSTDYCNSATYLREYYCDSGLVLSEGYTCPSGTNCTDGACVTISVTCTDTDGTSLTTKGTCSCTNGSTYTDVCDSAMMNDLVREYYVSGNQCTFNVLQCPTGQVCSNGICKAPAPTASCTDSDGGNVTSVKGTVSGVFASNGASFSLTDSCASGTLVGELYCGSDLMPHTATLPCPTGQTCTNGACSVPAPVNVTSGVGTIFITSTYYANGNLGGIAGADSKCQVRASAGGLSGGWIALISSATTSASSRVPDTVYKKVDGTTIANSKADLFDGSIASAIDITELGTKYTISDKAWTGSTTSGGVSNTCQSWTSSSSSYTGTLGHAYFTNNQWITYSTGALCGNYASLYCIRTS